MGFKWVLFLGFVLALQNLHAKESISESVNCSQLILQLRAMGKAQESLLGSMVRKNDSMAATLDQYAQNFEEKGQQLKRSDLMSLKRSAQAFRKHGDREKGLVVRFEKSSEELLAKVQTCLTASAVKSMPETSELVQR